MTTVNENKPSIPDGKARKVWEVSTQGLYVSAPADLTYVQVYREIEYALSVGIESDDLEVTDWGYEFDVTVQRNKTC